MTVTLVLPNPLAAEIREAAGRERESGAVLLAARVQGPDGDLRLLGVDLRWVPEDAYQRRTATEFVVGPEAYLEALAEAERRDLLPIWLHTHPGLDGAPCPSPRDRRVDEDLAETFRLRAGVDLYATLVVSPRPEGRLAFTGALVSSDGRSERIDRLWEVGDRWRLTRAEDAPGPPVPEAFDRNVRAFGAPIQQTLGDLRIAVVGAGGTGSALCEQLVRLGVRRLLLIDPDVLSDSNVTRVYGSTPADVGRPKVEIARDHLTRIAPDLTCETLQSMVTLEPVARRLAEQDLVFGCTDDNAGRLVLSRLASFMLTPVIDVGVLLSSGAADELTGIDGRVTTLTPGAGCLVCRGRIDLTRAAAELLTPEERKRRQDEGYAPALGGREPAVVAFTTAVAAAAVAELLERLIGYGPSPRPSELLLRWHDREMSANITAPREGHYCDRASGHWGRGDRAPFLGQVWPTT